MSDIKIPQELLNVIADINFDEIQSQSYSPSHFRNWLCAWHEKIKTELYDFANNHELYRQGRADAIEEVIKLYEEFQPKLATNVYEFGERIKALKK